MIWSSLMQALWRGEATKQPYRSVSMVAVSCLSDDDDDDVISLQDFNPNYDSECPLLRQNNDFRSSDSGWAGGNGLKPLQHDSVSETQIPPPSPGLLSTNSAWSELVRLGTSRKSSDAGLSDLSRSNSNSLSNVSSSLSEHLRYLVRAFSSRTEKVKETTVQPPSPSSLSEYANSDALSAISTENPQIRHRLDSFFPEPPEGDTVSEIVRIQEEDNAQTKFRIPKWIKKIKLPHVLEPQSKLYLFWLLIVTLAFMYNAWVIPLRTTFPYQTPANLKYWLMCDYTCDFIYVIDIIFFKCRITYLNSGLKETSRRNTRQNYFKKSMFKFDLLSLLPLDLLYLINMKVNPWYRLPRLLKIQTFWEFYSRCDHLVRSAHTVRILKTMTYMLFLIHIETCGYYAVSVYEGIGSNPWVYNGVGIAYIRCFYLATKTATSIGNNPIPTNNLEYSFMTVYWVSGVFVFALLIGQIRDIVDAANMVKTIYTKRMDAALQYVKNMNLPRETQDRVRTWFIYNWQQQKIIDEQKLMNALPNKLRTDLAIHVHFNTLSKVKLFQDCDKTLLYDLVLKLKPILFLPGDYVCKKGEIGKEMYIVSQGIVEVVGGPDNSLVLATLREGSVFGEISLLAMAAEGNRRTADVRCRGFTNLFVLSKAEFEAAMTDYPEAHTLLKKRAKKLLRANAKLQKKSTCSMEQSKINAEEIIRTPPETPKFVKTVIQVMDPDSELVRHLSSKRLSGSSAEEGREGAPHHSGNHNQGFDFGSEGNLAQPDTVEEFYDEMLKVEDWSDNHQPHQETQETEIKTSSVEKKTSNSSDSSCDSGVHDTKNATSSPSTTGTFSNKDSKESFISTELVDIAEDVEEDGRRVTNISEEQKDQDPASTPQHSLEILKETEREMILDSLSVAVNVQDTSSHDTKYTTQKEKSVVDDSPDVNRLSTQTIPPPSGNKMTTVSCDVQNDDDCLVQLETASFLVEDESAEKNYDNDDVSKVTVSTDIGKKDTGNKTERKAKLDGSKDRLRTGGSSKPPVLPLKHKTLGRKLESGKPKVPPKPDMKKLMAARGETSLAVKPKIHKAKPIKSAKRNVGKETKSGTDNVSRVTSVSDVTEDYASSKQKRTRSEILNVSNLPIITMERPSDDDNTDNSSEHVQSPQMGYRPVPWHTPSVQNTKGTEVTQQENLSDVMTDEPISGTAGQIPPENQVTCMVEIHREKSLTPSLPCEEQETATRKRKISVVSITSEHKDDETEV